jgi:hypothetical protein
MTMKKFFSNFWFLAVMTFVVNCSNSDETVPRIKCITCNSAIIMDGFGDEWKNNLTSVINENTSIGVCKDNEYLYLHLITSDPELSMQIMNFGLTLWFDVKGNQKKALGVQFPVTQIVPPPPKDGKPPVGDELQNFLNARLENIALEMPNSKKAKSMAIAEANKYGIDANIGIDGAILSYEVKYPLQSKSKNSYGLNLGNKSSLGICIETPKVDFHQLMQEQTNNHKPPEGEAGPQGQKPPEGTKPPEGQKPPEGTRPPEGQKPPDGTKPPEGQKPPEGEGPPQGQDPPGVERLQDVSNKSLRPKPPQMTRISQWIEVTF